MTNDECSDGLARQPERAGTRPIRRLQRPWL